MVNPFPSSGSPVVIASVADMTTLLRSASPENATAFAIAAHERACWGYDDGRVTFWEHVVEALGQRDTPAEAEYHDGSEIQLLTVAC